MPRTEPFIGLRQDRPQDERLAAYPLRVLRRDGAPLVISLALHVAAALLIAPWLVVRTIPAPQVEVEVMLEPQVPEPPSRPERAARVRSAARAQQPAARPAPPATVPQRVAEAPPTPVEPIPRVAPASQPGQGQAGRSAAAPRETAGLSVPLGSMPRAATAMVRSGPTALVRGSADAGRVAPRAPSLGSTPQPSARPVALAARAGEDRDDGPLALEGPASQVQSLQPEFRQAARTAGGQASLRGGGRSPEEGLARDNGSAGQTALLAARAVPQSVAGSGGGSSGAAASSVSAPRPPAAAAAAREAGGGGTAALAAAALTGAGGGSAAASVPLSPGGGRASAGLGSGSRRISPGETATGFVAAAPPAAAGAGSAAAGAGPGAAASGEGRTQHLAGRGSVPREAGAPHLVASGGEAAAAGAGSDTRAAQLSARSEGAAATTQPVREARAEALHTQQPTGEARVIEERFTAPALKVASPRSVCELPLLFAGFDRKPIPKGLDTINAAEPMPGETPPRHHPGNQAPRYPLQALGLRAEGRALVRAEVLEDGAVGQIWIKQSSGFQALDLAALDTVRGWRFYPAQRHGMAVTMWMDVPIEYKLP